MIRSSHCVKEEYKNLQWVWGADRKILLRVTVWHHEALPSYAKHCRSQEKDFSIRSYMCQTTMIRFFFLHSFWSPVFDINLGVAINESLFYTLTSAILKVDIVCDVAMTSTPNILTGELRDVLYNQCIDNMCCYSFCIYSTGQIRASKMCQYLRKTLSGMQEYKNF